MTAKALTAGVAGASTHGCVALASGQHLTAVCEQQRVTRVRAAGCNSTGVPDEALDLLLRDAGYTRADVSRYATAEPGGDVIDGKPVDRIDHHLAHASAAYLSSPYTSAAIVVCDQEFPQVSVWTGSGGKVTPIEWEWRGPGFADVYSACGAIFGFDSQGSAQRFESLARLRPDARDARVAALFDSDGSSLRLAASWKAHIEALLPVADDRRGCPSNAHIAAAVQNRIGELFLDFLTQVQRHTCATNLCLAGSFFYHSSMNTIAKRSGVFANVFVPVDPGNPGLAVGAALHASGGSPTIVSPFLGPGYDSTAIKATLDNCKLRYSWESDEAVIAAAVAALQKGLVVGWFEGRMEWGPRALGARSILASPFSPYVLENLNGFLKRREPWRGYAVSTPKSSLHDHFDGADDAPYMECDFRPLDPDRFRHVLPARNAAVRVQSINGQAPPRFRRLVQAFGAATGTPCLVNTSFNGFHEPIVCSPRDAVRVFYGTGVDVLVLEQFILSK